MSTQLKFTRKKQVLEFIMSECFTKRDEIHELEKAVDVKFVETVGYHLGIYYSNQYGYENLYTDKFGKSIINNLKRTVLWDINYMVNKFVQELDYNIKYLKFVKKYGHLFDTYKQAIEAFHEFVDNDTAPTEIDTKNVENVETTEEQPQKIDENCMNNKSSIVVAIANKENNSDIDISYGNYMSRVPTGRTNT